MALRRTITREQRDEVIRLWQEGVPKAEIIERLKMSEAKVAEFINNQRDLAAERERNRRTDSDFSDDVDWREHSLSTTKLLCKEDPAHGVQLVERFGRTFIWLRCGCRRPNVQAKSTFTGSDAAYKPKKSPPVFLDEDGP